MPLKWLVIGYGSPLHSDDRLGWLVAEQLEMMLKPRTASVVACHQLTPDLAEPISRSKGVIFIDASATLSPGHLACTALYQPDTNERSMVNSGAFTHYLTPQTVLDAACIFYGQAPPGWLYSIGAANFLPGEKLSPIVAAMIPEMVNACYERVTVDCRTVRIGQY
jgi:hydrogenase maturation protease